MNSNLFVKPLNTLHAQTFTGIEALMYQGENFLVALATGIAKIRENKKFDTASIKEGRLNEIATKFTGMNVTIAVERGFGAYMYMPPMDNSHPFQNNYLVTCPLFAASGEVVLKGKGDPIAEIDYTTAKVGGVYSMIPVNIFIGTDFFISEFTNEEIAAIILHELGHAWTYFLYLGRMYFANFLISSYANEIIGTKDVERRKILIKAAEKRLGIEIYNPNALAEQPSITKENVEILFINSHRYTLANTTGTDIYDFRSCEQLADYFATMHGAGPHLVSGLNRLYEMCGSEALIPGWLYTILEIRKLILLPILIPAWLGILLVCNPAMKRYDDPKARAKYVELQLKGVLKNKNLAPEVKRSLLDGIEAIGKDVDRLTDHQGIEHMFWTVLSPSYRRGVKQEQSQKVIESIIFNDLYQKAAIFDSMEELNPHLDEAAIVVADSRNEWAEDLLEYNQNSLDSDIDYLNNVATNIIEDGVVTEDQIASIESICMKYGVKPTISVEEFNIKRNVVSIEAISGWAMAGIAAAIAVLIAIAWKIIKWIMDKGDDSKVSSETTNKLVQENNSVQQLVDSGQNQQATKTMLQNAKTNNPKITVGEIDLGIRTSIRAAASGSTAPVVTPKPTSSVPDKPKVPELFIYTPQQLDALGRCIDDEFMAENISFKSLFKSHCALDPTLVTKYGKNGLTYLDELTTYLDFYFKKKPSQHIEDYLKSNNVPNVGIRFSKLDSSNINKCGNALMNQSKTLQNIVDLLLQAFDPKVMATFNGVAKDNKPYLKSNKKFTAANYLEDYFAANYSKFVAFLSDEDDKKCFNVDYNNFHEVLAWDNDSVPLNKTKAFSDSKKINIKTTINAKDCAESAAVIIRKLEANNNDRLTDEPIKYLLDLWNLKVSEDGAHFHKFVIISDKALSEYYNNVIKMVINYEKRVASWIGMMSVVNGHLTKIKKFYTCSFVTLGEYMNTPG